MDDYFLDEIEYCYECQGYGDDYYDDEDGNLIHRCPECIFNPFYNPWDE